MLSQTYDHEADALYIRLREGTVAATQEVDSCTLVDVDETGAALGIEVLHPARDWPIALIIERYDIEAEDRALLEAMYPKVGRGARFSFTAPDRDASTAASLVTA